MRGHAESPAMELQQRRNALRALLVLTLPGGALLLLLNLRLGAGSLALLSGVMVLTALGLLLATRRAWPLQTLALVYLAVLYVNIVAALARPDLHPGTTSSIAVLPVLAYLLLERRLALPVTVVSLLASAVAYWIGALVAPYRYDALLVANVSLPVVTLFVVCHFYAQSRARSAEQMLERVFRDPLTGLWNRAKLEEEFERERRRVRRTGDPLSLLVIDLDRFKGLNDEHGHDAGDAALVHAAGLLAGRLREIDVTCRIGGEEFAVLLPDTGRAGATMLADELRRTLESSRFEHRGRGIAMTASIGIAELGADGDDWDALYQTADARLYEAKASGRNRVVSGARDGLAARSRTVALGHSCAEP